MSYTYKTLVRDKLVDNAGIKTLFSATSTGSCRVNMEFLNVSAIYPQILIGYDGGETRGNLDADEGRITLTIEVKGTGSTHAYKELGNFRSAIINVVDDKPLSGTAVCYLFKKFSELEGFDEDKKVWSLRMGFNAEYKQQTNLP